MAADLSDLVLKYEKYHQRRLKKFYEKLVSQPKK